MIYTKKATPLFAVGCDLNRTAVFATPLPALESTQIFSELQKQKRRESP
jgi:hypothetical protein